MNLKEQLAALIKEFEAAETMEEATRIKGEIEAIKAKIALAEKKQSVLDGFKSSEPASVGGSDAIKSLGRHFAKAFGESHNVRGQRFSFVAPEFKTDPVVHTIPSSIQPALTDIDRRIVEGYRRPLVVADLLGSESISGNALTYFVESSSVTGGFAPVAEGAAKPQMSFGEPTPVTESLVKIAAFYKESDEIIEDAAWLASSIDNRALYLHDLYEENQILSGSGSSGQLTGLLNRSGIQTATYSNQDSIFSAMTSIQTATGFAPDAVVINPADYQTLRLSKDSNNQYYGGGFFYGAYGNTGMVEQPAIWGLRTVVTSAIPQGTVLVGAFKQGASLIRKGGTSVEMVNTNENDFIYNRVTIRIESRLALAVRYPQAFVKLTASNPL